jgi:prevent-host-death family protein
MSSLVSGTEGSAHLCATLTHMAREAVGVRALQQNASEVVKRAAAGEIVDITDRGRLVAHLIPANSAGFQRLLDAGVVRSASRSIRDLPPAIRVRGGQPKASDVLAKQREHER